MKDLALSSISSIDSRDSLEQHLKALSTEQLFNLTVQLGLIAKNHDKSKNRQFLLELVYYTYERRVSYLEEMSDTAVYPNEDLLWNDNAIPIDTYIGDHCLALPKLNLQFLSYYDYFLRNYDLFRLESAYGLRIDIEDAISRCKPRRNEKGATVFTGWSSMAIPIQEFAVTKVGKAKLGEEKPSSIEGSIVFSLDLFSGNESIRRQWDQIRLHDVLFLISFQPSLYPGEKTDPNLPFVDQYGVKYIRGCEVIGFYDENGKPIREFDNSAPSGSIRKMKVLLDANQYQQDLITKDEDVYGTFSLLLRRKQKKNNFKAVLETIRDLMQTSILLPKWLDQIFLGYGRPEATRVICPGTYDFHDTFLDIDHVKETLGRNPIRYLDFNGKEVTQDKLKHSSHQMVPPFKVSFSSDKKGLVTVQPHKPLYDIFTKNYQNERNLRFTPNQIEAIQASIHQGLTLVVGAPGTGKTDVAVQIISNWYHNFPNQKTLLVTHSNQALNQLFDKLVKLDIDHRHLVRLGHGEEYLETTHDFSKYGRVNHLLSRRLDILGQVDRLAKTMGIKTEVAISCDTAEYFFQSQIRPKCEAFKNKYSTRKQGAITKEDFPFYDFFSELILMKKLPTFVGNHKDLFPSTKSLEENLFFAQSCILHLENLFAELKDTQAMEILRYPLERGNHIVSHQAKIVALTSTHAALKRQSLLASDFEYDNVIMEEAAQIMEIETFIPLLLQENGKRKESRLKRLVLIGDHNQLPPIVQNIAFQKFSHLEQSMFTRFIRLGVPAIHLEAQVNTSNLFFCLFINSLLCFLFFF